MKDEFNYNTSYGMMAIEMKCYPLVLDLLESKENDILDLLRIVTELETRDGFNLTNLKILTIDNALTQISELEDKNVEKY